MRKELAKVTEQELFKVQRISREFSEERKVAKQAEEKNKREIEECN